MLLMKSHTNLLERGKVPWQLPEKDILSINANDRLVVTATLTIGDGETRDERHKSGRVSKRDRQLTDTNSPTTFFAGFGHEQSQQGLDHFSLVLKDRTMKVVRGGGAAGKPESEAAKP